MATIRDRIRELSQGRAILIDDHLEVVQTHRVSPNFQRVTLAGDCLATYLNPRPADAFKIDIGTRDAPLIRGFTVCDFDPTRLSFHFDVALHAGGSASEWSRTIAAGHRLRFLGFRRDFAIGDGITEHVFITDASGLPAVAAILRSLPADHKVILLAETADRVDRELLEPSIDALGGRIQTQWLVGAPSQGLDSALARAAARLSVPEGAQVWLAAESATVRTIRRHLLDEGGVPRGNLHATAYWICGLTSSERDDREAIVYRNAVNDGLDVMDPAIYDRLEFDDQPA
ncbi:siderophore-interacting protein [Agreia sp.]|uniref:siderophore-interacting protein n=1 Tax=Agreia sp. TaxID=1872416 RepID=UPI0035BBCA36